MIGFLSLILLSSFLMKSDRYPIPTLRSLLSFEASVRHMNFTKAAEELNVTPSAISKNIHSLEEHLGTRVFIRSKHGLEVTRKGKEFYLVVTNAMQSICTEVQDIQKISDFSREVKFSAARFDGGFFSHALLPGLHNFTESHPEVSLVLEEIEEVSASAIQGADIAYIHGDPNSWKGFHVWELCEEKIFPVCSPEYYIKIDSSFLSDQLHIYNLIESSTKTSTFRWDNWIKTQHNPHARLPKLNVVVSYTLAIQAAIAGEGIALAWMPDVAEQLRNGTLLKLGSRTVKTGSSYFIVAPKDRRLRPEVTATIEWVIATVQGVSNPKSEINI